MNVLMNVLLFALILALLGAVVALILTPKAASPPALEEDRHEVNETGDASASQATSDEEKVEKQLLESSEHRLYSESSVFSGRSHSEVTRHRW